MSQVFNLVPLELAVSLMDMIFMSSTWDSKKLMPAVIPSSLPNFNLTEKNNKMCSAKLNT